jgi:hypothetical protein
MGQFSSVFGDPGARIGLQGHSPVGALEPVPSADMTRSGENKMSRTTFWTALICVSIVAGVAFSLVFYG